MAEFSRRILTDLPGLFAATFTIAGDRRFFFPFIVIKAVERAIQQLNS